MYDLNESASLNCNDLYLAGFVSHFFHLALSGFQDQWIEYNLGSLNLALYLSLYRFLFCVSLFFFLTTKKKFYTKNYMSLKKKLRQHVFIYWKNVFAMHTI